MTTFFNNKQEGHESFRRQTVESTALSDYAEGLMEAIESVGFFRGADGAIQHNATFSPESGLSGTPPSLS